MTRGYCKECNHPILHHTSYCQGQSFEKPERPHYHELMCEVDPCKCVKLQRKDN